VYSLRDFFQEIFPFTPNQSARRLPLMSLILLPPMSVSTINPSIFFTALDYAGALSISVLGSIIPALIAWKQRYQQQRYNLPNQLLVPGGKVTLILMIGVALMVIGQQIL
jgi:tyrosine-specific transport protein